MTNAQKIQTLNQLLQALTGSHKPRPSEKDLLIDRAREMIVELERLEAFSGGIDAARRATWDIGKGE